MSLKEESSQSSKIRLGGSPQLVFNDYKKTAMYLPLGVTCSGKCWRDLKADSSMCQNWENNGKWSEYNVHDIIDGYLGHPFYNAVVISGMEPLDNFHEVLFFVDEFRKVSQDDIVIYTGYNVDEASSFLIDLKMFNNIFVKVGRYNPNLKRVEDGLTGVNLVSDNQKFIKVT